MGENNKTNDIETYDDKSKKKKGPSVNEILKTLEELCEICRKFKETEANKEKK